MTATLKYIALCALALALGVGAAIAVAGTSQRAGGKKPANFCAKHPRHPSCPGTTTSTTTTPPTTTTTTTPAPDPPGLRQVDGGTDYYGHFSNPLPTGPGYFPIGVWGSYNQTQANRDLDADVGINLYVWAADPGFLDEIRADGRFRAIVEPGMPERRVRDCGMAARRRGRHDRRGPRAVTRSRRARRRCPTAARPTPTTARASSPAGRRTRSSHASWRHRSSCPTTSTGSPTPTYARACPRGRPCSVSTAL